MSISRSFTTRREFASPGTAAFQRFALDGKSGARRRDGFHHELRVRHSLGRRGLFGLSLACLVSLSPVLAHASAPPSPVLQRPMAGGNSEGAVEAGSASEETGAQPIDASAGPTEETEAETGPTETGPTEIGPESTDAGSESNPGREPAGIAPLPSESDAGTPGNTALRPLPTPSSALPTYDAAPQGGEPGAVLGGVVQPEPTVVRKDGRGMIAAGGVLVGGGVSLALISGVLLSQDNLSADRNLWIAGTTLGLLAGTLGAALIGTGNRRRVDYRDWVEDQDRSPPPQGNGMRASGTMLLVAGGMGLTVGGLALATQDADGLPYGEVLLGLGGTAGLAGLALVITGIAQERRFTRYRDAHMVVAARRHSLMPSFGLLRGGAQIGVSGKF